VEKQLVVRGTLDDLSALVDAIAPDSRYVISPPSRLKGGLFDRPGDAQLEILEIVIGLGSNIVAAVAYDELKALVRMLKRRGNQSLDIDGESDELPPER
jgi:hypothetical protein